VKFDGFNAGERYQLQAGNIGFQAVGQALTNSESDRQGHTGRLPAHLIGAMLNT
jgi:hypothetical protein